jgi:hypothetical protein
MLSDDATAHDVCYRCGYDLTGIGDETPCPECGLLARRSRRPTDELHYTRPRWLRRISRGTNLLLLAVLLFGASPALAVVLTKLSYAMLPARGYEWLLPHVPLLAVHAAALFALAARMAAGVEGGLSACRSRGSRPSHPSADHRDLAHRRRDG